MNQRWIPTFLGNFVADSQLIEQLESVNRFSDQENARLQTKLHGAGISGDKQRKIIRAINVVLGHLPPLVGLTPFSFSWADCAWLTDSGVR